ncbi:MAG: sigma-70 family RNA polymerase sigma factor [Acidobacteriota bacterium]|nr:sigma-70 family RNA polymerase sigma factor [Acidobacteriota bacterium]
MNLNESQLIESARAGNAEAFSQLARRFERRVYTLALHYTRDSSDAEDLSQEVWLKAFRSINSFRGDSAFYTWLRKIMVNTFLNHKRAETARVEEIRGASTEDDSSDLSDDLSFIPVDRPHKVEEDYERRILVGRVMRALGELSSQQRLIFLLKHREGMTYEEISNAFGCSVGTVKKALFRAVQKLREQIGVSPAPLAYLRCGAGRR